MSHTIGTSSNDNLQFSDVTIVNYVAGGETFTLADFPSVLRIIDVILGNISPNRNSLGVALFPLFTGSKVLLFQFVGGVPTEIASTPNLNASFGVILLCGA